jgi:hypothetical protein
MAWAYEQNFNALSTATLDGQDSWGAGVNPTRFNVVTTPTYEGAKSVAGTCSDNGNEYTAYIARAFTAVTDGSVYFAVRWGSNSASEVRAWTHFGGGVSGADEFTMVAHYFGKIQLLQYSGGAPFAWVDVETGLSADTWYPINLELDSATQNGKARIRVYKNGAWGSWSAWTQGRQATTSVDAVRFSCDRGAVGTSSFLAYWDTITTTDPTAASPTLLGSRVSGTAISIKNEVVGY